MAGATLVTKAGNGGRWPVRRRPTARFVNGLAAAGVTTFFFAHAFFGGLGSVVVLSVPPVWVIWSGMAVVAFHVAASIVTSYQQLADKEFPPSARKKRHLALKWATGIALVLATAAHVVCVGRYGPEAAQVAVTGTLAAIALAAVLAMHVYVGAKSLLVDLGFNKRSLNAFRMVVVALAVLIVALVVVGAVW